jgi:DNA-binding transcriptional regulator YiaG
MTMTGDELRYHRRKLGLTQVALAKRLGAALRTVRYWERGDAPWCYQIPGPAEAVVRLLLTERGSSMREGE